MSVRLLLALLLGRMQHESPSLRRYGSILRGGATAVIAKGVSFVAGLASVPLTLRYLGTERYGLWASLFSILAWLTLADLGLANGLLPALSEAFAKRQLDSAREYVSAAFWGLCATALALGILIVFSVHRLDWAALLRVSSPAVGDEFGLAVLVAAVVFLLNLPFTIVVRVYTAAQRTEIANYWAMAATVAGLAGLAAAIVCRGSLSALVLGYSGAQTLVGVASGVWMFARSFPNLRPRWGVTRSAGRKVFGISFAYFLSQLANAMIFQSGNLIIAHNLGPRQIVPYQVAWTMALYIMVPLQIVSSTLWATIGEAYAHNEIDWIRRLAKRYALAGLVIGGPLILLFLVAGDRIAEAWAGAAARPSRELLSWMAAWACELVLLQPLLAVLGGIGKLRAYSVFSVLAATATVIGASAAVQSFGSTGVIAATVISFLCLQLVPAMYLTMKVLGYSFRAVAHA